MPFNRLRKDEARLAMADLVAEYQQQAADLEAASSPYTEMEARGQFIDRFMIILGWDVHNQAGLPQASREVVLERAGTGERDVTGRPDYRLRVAAKDRLPVEAKKPSVRLSLAGPAAVQARSYGWSLSLPAAVLTNMAETVIYDATQTPADGDSASVAVIPGCRFTAAEYVSRFDELWDRLSLESAGGDDFYSVYSYTEPPRGTSPFDQTFLTEFRKWRLRLASDIASNGPHLNAQEVGRRTQRLLNALLFLRVCEDRNIGQYEGLLKSAEASLVIDAFRDADRIFNAGLFDVLTTTKVSDAQLVRVIKEMYWPRSKFAFGVLRPDTLAALYEQYLAEAVEVDGTRKVALVEKPELTHAGGVVPTPGFVVEALVHAGIDPLLVGGVIPADLRALDLSCGSGVFLVQLLDLLIAVREASGAQLTLADRAALVEDHLFGVDLDGAAVEVARLSLLLAVLGDDVVDTTRARALLPDLSANLLVGNALIAPDFDTLLPSAAGVVERRAAVAPLDLEAHFKPAIDAGGFSLVFGNPPYIRIQTLSAHLADHLAYYQDPRSGYVSAQAYNFDIYHLFVERALTLLAPSGRLAYIVPNRFTNGLAGASMRKLLGPRLERLVHFGEEQLFERRTTYTALVLAGPVTAAPAVFEIVKSLASWRGGLAGDFVEVRRTELTADPWPIASPAATSVFESMLSASIGRLGDPDWVHVFVGVQTSDDDVFLIKPDESVSTPDLVWFDDFEGTRREIERAILRPALRKQRIRPLDYNPEENALAIFPYTIEQPLPGRTRRKARVLTPEELAADYPRALAYLEAHKHRLERNRDVTPDPGLAFYAYGRSQSLTQLDEPKIIARVLSLTPSYAQDDDGLLVTGGGDGGPYYLLRARERCPYSHQVLQAILSHPAVDAFVASRGKAYRGSYVVHRKKFLVDIPMPDLDQATQSSIEAAVDEVHGLVRRLRTESDTSLQRTILGRIASLRATMEEQISTAYGLTADDVAAVVGV